MSISTSFSWLNEQEIKKLDISSLSENSPTGYILEVDLYYPYYLHDSYSDFPLAAEEINISYEML